MSESSCSLKKFSELIYKSWGARMVVIINEIGVMGVEGMDSIEIS